MISFRSLSKVFLYIHNFFCFSVSLLTDEIFTFRINSQLEIDKELFPPKIFTKFCKILLFFNPIGVIFHILENYSMQKFD